MARKNEHYEDVDNEELANMTYESVMAELEESEDLGYWDRLDDELDDFF